MISFIRARIALNERVEYGRMIRDRAACLLEAHGSRAQAEALIAACEPGIPDAERSFWEAVAARIVRLGTPPRGLALA
jgi:hypothetical protein